MKNYSYIVFITLSLACSAQMSFADITNGGFETNPPFTGWNFTANHQRNLGTRATGAQGTISAPVGQKMGKVTLGSLPAGNFIDFNFMYSSSETVAAGDRVQAQVKILYNTLEGQGEVLCLEVILDALHSGQPLLATVEIDLNNSKSVLTNILTGVETTADLISSHVSTGFDLETDWLIIDVDVSDYAGDNAPISFFMTGGNHVSDDETILYLFDDVKLAP